MRNHILLNNNNSMNIRGLMIQSLPPISLPKMRTRTEEIDGRDGDIITRLGFSAYDKKIKIGLTYNYDVDEVIAYFNNNSAGEVVFSNESDKIYRYEILDQIDFERLLRFKEAEVTFHCQPYKYDATETEIDYTNTFTEDTVPYIYRASPHDANMMKLKKVVGGTIAWNQIAQKGVGTANGATRSYDSTTGVTTITPSTYTGNAVGAYGLVPSANLSSHKYYMSIMIDTDNSGGFKFGFGGNLGDTTTISSGGYNRLERVSSWVSSSLTIYARALESGWTSGTFRFKDVMCIDLTQMFGSTIADYIYSLEQAHAGDGVAWFKALFGEDYYPYNAGELLSVKTSARKTYNADNVEIGSYALDGNLTLRGIPKLDSNNELYYDGDTYASDGTVTRKYGIVDLGTLNWNNDPNRAGTFHTSGISSTIKKTPSKSANLVCGKYIMRDASVPSAGNLSTNDKQISSYPSYGGGYVYIIDTAYGSSTAEQFKTAMSGVYLVYELATPTTESADAYTQSQRVGATEEFVDGRTVEIPVGNNTLYYDGTPEITVVNSGNVPSKPIMTIYATGTITVSLNGNEIFTIDMGDNEYIVIDTEEMNAYMGGVLLNRNVTGDYSQFALAVGDNTLSFTGSVTNVLIERYSRWI